MIQSSWPQMQATASFLMILPQRVIKHIILTKHFNQNMAKREIGENLMMHYDMYLGNY